MAAVRSLACWCMLIMAVLFSAFVFAENKSKNDTQAVETVGEVSIIGNTELPNVSFNLPWRLPTVENRAEQSPPTELPGMLQPLEPRRHKQQVYFSRFLQLEIPEFSKR